MIQKHQTACCALCQITASNEDSLEYLKAMVDKIRQEALYSWTPENRAGGERAIYVITGPGETILEDNLEKLFFYQIGRFKRRNGYAPGQLRMWMLKF